MAIQDVITANYGGNYSAFSQQVQGNLNSLRSTFSDMSGTVMASQLYLSESMPLDMKQMLYNQLMGLIESAHSSGRIGDREYVCAQSLAAGGFVFRPSFLNTTDQLEIEARRYWWDYNGFYGFYINALKIGQIYDRASADAIAGSAISLYDGFWDSAYSILKKGQSDLVGFIAGNFSDKLNEFYDNYAKAKDSYNWAMQNPSAFDLDTLNQIQINNAQADYQYTYVQQKLANAGLNPQTGGVSGLGDLGVAPLVIGGLVVAGMVALAAIAIAVAFTAICIATPLCVYIWTTVDKAKLAIYQQQLENPNLSDAQRANILQLIGETDTSGGILSGMTSSIKWVAIAALVIGVPVIVYLAAKKYKSKGSPGVTKSLTDTVKGILPAPIKSNRGRRRKSRR